MPISRDEFDSGRKDNLIIDKIYEFLDSNKDKAFTEDEILRQLYPDQTAWPIDRIGFIVQSLSYFMQERSRRDMLRIPAG